MAQRAPYADLGTRHGCQPLSKIRVASARGALAVVADVPDPASFRCGGAGQVAWTVTKVSPVTVIGATSHQYEAAGGIRARSPWGAVEEGFASTALPFTAAVMPLGRSNGSQRGREPDSGGSAGAMAVITT